MTETVSPPEDAFVGDHARYLKQFAWRSSVSRAQHESERYCRSRGVTAPQYHALLAIKAYEKFTGPTVGRIAEALCVVPSTTVGLVDRLEAQGFVERHPDRWDRRIVRLGLTERGEELVEDLADWHRDQLRSLAAELATALSLAGGAEPVDAIDHLSGGSAGDPSTIGNE